MVAIIHAIHTRRDDSGCADDVGPVALVDGVLDGVKECGEIEAIGPEQLGEYRRIIRQASLSLAAGQRDAAALLLDGMAQRLALEWFAGHGLAAPTLDYLLAHLEERQSILAWWLRLALRAPNIEARLFHCRRMLAEIDGDQKGEAGATLPRN